MKLKRLLLATALAFSFTVSAPSVAKADPVTAAIVTWAGFTAGTTAFAVATFVVNSALYSAAGWATSKLLSGKQKANVQERQAQVTTLSLGESPREAVIGMACVGGSLVDVWNWGGQYGTDYVTRCIALADHAVEDLYGYYVDDVFYPFSASGVQPGFSGTLTIIFVNGAAEGSPPPSFAQSAGWDPADRMTGMTHVWVTTKFDDQVWTQGHPRFRWVLHGLRCFDARIPTHVWADRSTHTFTRNPALIRHALARGIYVEGRQGQAEHLLIGRGLTEEEAPTTRLLAAANLCDELVAGVSRYYTDGVISADMDFITVEEMFASAMAGVIVQHEGGVEVEPGQAKAVVATITDDDLVVGEPVTFSEFLPDNDGGRINTVVPRYVEPAQNWADHSGPVRRDLADIAADGGPRELTLNMPLVTGGAVADRNAEITRRLARLERRAAITLPPQYSDLEEGDWIAWKSDRYHNGQTVRYRIESWSVDKQWRTYLTLREIASSVFGVPDPLEDKAEPPAPPTPIDALALTGVTAEAIQLPGEASIMPAIRMGWGTPDSAVRAIRAEVRISGQTDATPTRTEDVAAGVMVVTNGVAAGQEMQARLVPIGEPSRPIVPSPWLTVSTSELVAAFDPDAPALADIRAEARAKAALLIKEAASRWNRDETDKRFGIQNFEYVSEQLLITKQTLELADENQIALLEVERTARIDGITAETEARQLQISGVGEALAVVDERSKTTATALMAETEARTTQVSAVGEALALVDQKAATAVGTASAAAAATTALSSEVDDIEATATLALSTAADASTQLGAASFAVEVAAGGDPAMIYARAKGATSVAGMVASVLRFANTVSGTAVEAMRLFAGEVFFMRPIYIDVGFKRLIVGPGSDWVMWFGPNTINAASATRTNGHWAFGSDGKVYYGSTELGSGGGLSATASPDIASGSAPGGGYVSTGTVTINVTGPGAASAVVRWIKTEETGGTVDINAGGRTASFGGTVSPGGLTRAIYLAVVTAGGQSTTVVVDVQLTDSN